MILRNAPQGQVFLGVHFYPGVAEYQDAQDNMPYRVFLNEDTIRKMDPTFKGKPVYVQHVEDVEQDLDKLKMEVDGWVIRSFWNEADGKHWCEFIICSERGLEAVRRGWRLSNAYLPKSFTSGGLWNGVSYVKEITDGEYEHLAIVPNPRYEESVIMTPEQFKKHNEEKLVELKRISNSKGVKEMALNFFKRAKVENASDVESMSVVLPKTKREVTIAQLINDADHEEKPKDMNSGMADPAHKVKMFDGSYCNVAELVEKHKALHDELEGMKAKKEDGEDQDKEYEEKGEPAHNKEGKEMPEGDTPSDLGKNAEDDEGAKKKALELAEHEDKEIEAAKKKNAREAAARLRNAGPKAVEVVDVELSEDRVARGKARYGSGN